jgi:hypothetical protein
MSSALAKAVSKLVRPLAVRQGLADGRLACQWSALVGPEMARGLRPLSLSPDGVLKLEAASSSWAMQAQYRAPLLIEMLNSYFGYAAVKRVVFSSTYFVPKALAAPTPVVPDQGAWVRAAAQTAHVADTALRDALLRLGAQMEARHSAPAAYVA